VFLDVIYRPYPKFNLTKGQIIPVLVRTERLRGLKEESAVALPPAVKTCPSWSPTN
jgi:hypothetical protein